MKVGEGSPFLALGDDMVKFVRAMERTPAHYSRSDDVIVVTFDAKVLRRLTADIPKKHADTSTGDTLNQVYRYKLSGDILETTSTDSKGRSPDTSGSGRGQLAARSIKRSRTVRARRRARRSRRRTGRGRRPGSPRASRRHSGPTRRPCLPCRALSAGARGRWRATEARRVQRLAAHARGPHLAAQRRRQ